MAITNDAYFKYLENKDDFEYIGKPSELYF